MKNDETNPVVRASTTDLIIELVRMSENEALTPFPSEDFREVVAKAGPEFEICTAILDLYCYELWSPCNAARRLPRYSDLELLELKQEFSKPFFERYTQCVSLEAMINEDSTPALHKELMVFEKMRRDLVSLITCLLEERANSEISGEG